MQVRLWVTRSGDWMQGVLHPPKGSFLLDTKAVIAWCAQLYENKAKWDRQRHRGQPAHMQAYLPDFFMQRYGLRVSAASYPVLGWSPLYSPATSLDLNSDALNMVLLQEIAEKQMASFIQGIRAHLLDSVICTSHQTCRPSALRLHCMRVTRGARAALCSVSAGEVPIIRRISRNAAPRRG